MKTVFFRYSVFVLLIGFINHTTSFAQEPDVVNYRMLYNFKTVKQQDNSRVLELSFIARNKKDRKDKIPVFDAEIKFYNTLNEEAVLLGTSKTSKEGIANITLPENHQYLMDSSGKINLKAHFEGNDVLDEEEETLSVQNLFLELDLKEIDSIKTVLVNAFTRDSLGNQLPVKRMDIIISVNGMLSKMKLEEGTVKRGKFEFEIPTDIPGNANGYFTVYAIVEDNDDFGNVIQEKTANWGVFNKQDANNSNTLWSEAAPIWMYVLLTILLVGVWANYVYTIINLLSIKKEGKALELETET
jgi:hypothetical protein